MVGAEEVLVSMETAWGEMQAGKAGEAVEAEVLGKAAVEVAGFDEEWVLCLWAATEEPGVGWGLPGCAGPSL